MGRSYDVWIGRGAQAISQERNIVGLANTHGQDIHIIDDTAEVSNIVTNILALEGLENTPARQELIDTITHSDVSSTIDSTTDISVLLPHLNVSVTPNLYVMKQNTVHLDVTPTPVATVFPDTLSPRLYIASGTNHLTLRFHVIHTTSSSDPAVNKWNFALATKIHKVPGGSLFTEYHQGSNMKFVRDTEVTKVADNFSATFSVGGTNVLRSLSDVDTDTVDAIRITNPLAEKFAMNIYRVDISNFDDGPVIVAPNDLSSHTIEFIRVDLVPGQTGTASTQPDVYGM